MSNPLDPISCDELLQAAQGLDPMAAKALRASDLLQPKRFEYDFVSYGWPELNGRVVIRYPNLENALQIERLSLRGGPFAELFATMLVCMEKAPATWYRIPEHGVSGKAPEPELATDTFQDSEGLLLMWGAFLDWRASFRRPASAPGGPTS